MQVQLLVTRTDFSTANLDQEFRELGVPYELLYIEDHPELVAAHGIQHSPCILVDGQLAFREQPTESQLREYFERNG
ncbi:thioredoxin domain-containing protein [Zobellella maritima]|uniref:hypothetical protein n=1 Tax=Zobellella maritima TaxID=2059725 RepID=UPI000E3077DE|nr:hypothetical protein [Zobellella maritima]